MPIYEYQCLDCGQICEVLVAPSGAGAEPVRCTSCGGRNLEKIMSAASFVVGTDSRPAGRTCCGRQERCAAPPCSTGGGGGCGRHP